MMTIRIEINGEPLVVVDVFNRGPVDDLLGPMTHGSTWRRYEWFEAFRDMREEPRESGQVFHDRSEGAEILAALVLNQLGARRPES